MPPAYTYNYNNCPRCGASTRPSKTLSGAPSVFWKECMICNTYINTYRPMPHQAAVHKDDHTFVGNFGGYGTGKTMTSMEEFYKHLFLTPNGNTLIGANITQQYEQTIKRDIEADLPVAFVKDVSTQKSYIDFINGHRLLFRPLDDEGKLRSLNLSMFIIVEASEVDAEIYAQLKTRLRNMAPTKQAVKDGVPQFHTDEHGNQLPLIEFAWHKGIIESNPDSGWIRNDVLLASDNIQKHGNIEDTYAVMEEQRDEATSSHVASTDSNAFLPPDPQTFIKNICKNKPSWWVRRYVQGSFSYAEGLVYPKAMDCVIPDFDIPRQWLRVIAFDYGLSDDSVFLFGAIDEKEGLVYIYKELRDNNRSVEELAQLYFQGCQDIPSGGIYGQPIIDPKSGPKRDYEKKTLGDHFLEYGINFKPGAVSVDARVFRTNTYIESGRLKIFQSCAGLIKELQDYKYPNRKLGSSRHSDKPVDKNNHAINPLEWIVMELPADPRLVLHDVYNRHGESLSDARHKRAALPWALQDEEDNFSEEDAFVQTPW